MEDFCGSLTLELDLVLLFLLETQLLHLNAIVPLKVFRPRDIIPSDKRGTLYQMTSLKGEFSDSYEWPIGAKNIQDLMSTVRHLRFDVYGKTS